jgi:D-amino-acid dehydrogenase
MIRFALNSRPARVEAISTALYSLMRRGVEAYRPLIAGTEAEGILSNRGHLYAYRRREALDSNSFVFGLRRRRGVTYEILDDAAMSKLSPLFAGRFETGVYFPKAHWTADPRAFTQALLASFVDKGGRVARADVRGFATNDGRVVRVRTDQSDVTTGAVVISAGPWSRGLLRQLGTNVPLDCERGYGADLPRPDLQLDVPVILADVHSALTPHRTGVRLAGYDELASLSAPADPKLPQRLIRSARKVFPRLCAEGGTFWMRRRPSTPDSLPVIGRAPRFENTYLAFGHGHKGLCMGGITGKLVQELMDGAPTTVDITPFRPTRFRMLAGF